MQELYAALLVLDCLYQSASLAEYEQAKCLLEAHIQTILPGFTIAYAVEIGPAGAGEQTYQHGGVAHVLLPVREQVSK